MKVRRWRSEGWRRGNMRRWEGWKSEEWRVGWGRAIGENRVRGGGWGGVDEEYSLFQH